MIDARFIEAKRRAAKYPQCLSLVNILRSCDAQTGHRRRRQHHRGEKPENDDLEFSRDAVPLMSKSLFTAPSPQSQPIRPSAVSPPTRNERQAPVKTSTTMDSLEQATLNLSIQEESQFAKPARQRGRNRGRSNVSKTSSPQRT